MSARSERIAIVGGTLTMILVFAYEGEPGVVLWYYGIAIALAIVTLPWHRRLGAPDPVIHTCLWLTLWPLALIYAAKELVTRR